MDIKNKKVFVAMSGGVDSSVAAGLMKERGADVAGITMCFNISYPDSRRPSCCGADGIEDARRAARVLGIPHYVLNFAADIEEGIIRNFTEEYLGGRTPNPCVRCNQTLKFGSLLARSLSLGADFLATGHYARIRRDPQTGDMALLKGKDEKKEQSYFLYGMKRDVLYRVLFPLGNLTKPQVRELARRYGLANAEKPGSQDICFVPSDGYQGFLERRAGAKMRNPGLIKDAGGRRIGEHKGIAHYTVGQRDGLGVAAGHPVYVYKIEKDTNTVFVGEERLLYSGGLAGSGANYISMAAPASRFRARVHIRYNHPGCEAWVHPLEEGRVRIEFDRPQRSVTPGQSAVFYDGETVLGGAVIDEALPCPRKEYEEAAVQG